MEMKTKWIAIGIFLGLWSASAMCSDILEETNLYAGLEFKYNNMKPQGIWNKFFIKHHPGFVFYVGDKMNDYWGVDAGFDWTTEKSQSYTVGATQNIFGLTNNAAQNELVTSKIRLKSGYLDLNAYLPLQKLISSIDNETYYLLATVGISFTKPSVEINTPTTTSNFDGFVQNIKGVNQRFVRLGLGAQGMITEFIGVRAMWRWANTSQIHIKGDSAALSNYNHLFKDNYAYSLGLIYKF